MGRNLSDLVFNSLLNNTFYRLGVERVSDDQGGFIKEYFSKAAIEGRLRPATGRERESAMQEERVITHVFYCNVDTDLTRGDFISPGVMLDNAGVILGDDIIVKIEGRREPSTANHHFEFDCIEYQKPESYAEVS